MKKVISISLLLTITISLVSVSYAGNKKNNNGKGNSNRDGGTVTTSFSPEHGTDVLPGDALTQQLKPNHKSNENGKKNRDMVKEAPEAVPEIVPADTLEGLQEQLKNNHKNKTVRKQLLGRIREVRKQVGDNTIPVVVNGRLMEFDVPPVIKYNRTLIPVRAVANALGASVDWDRETNDVTVTKSVYTDADVNISTEINVVIDLDTGKFYKDGTEVDFDVPAQVVNNRTVVPIRFLAEIFGMKVDWDEDLDGVVVEEEEKVTDYQDTETSATPTAAPVENSEPEPTPTT